MNLELFHYTSGIIGGAVTLLGFMFYCWYLLTVSHARPARVGWIIWSIVTFLTMIFHASANNAAFDPFSFISQLPTLTTHTPTMFFAIGNFVGCTAVALLALWRGKGGWTSIDKFSLVGAIVSIFLWLISGSGLLALIVSLCADFCGAIPTIEHASCEPGGESRLAWGTFAVGTIITGGGIGALTIEECAFPMYFLFIDCFIVFIVLFPNSRLTLWTRNKYEQFKNWHERTFTPQPL
ncbi:MAG: hypothetical protein AAB400_02315 [Patescibacteria group bacterium]